MLKYNCGHSVEAFCWFRLLVWKGNRGSFQKMLQSGVGEKEKGRVKGIYKRKLLFQWILLETQMHHRACIFQEEAFEKLMLKLNYFSWMTEHWLNSRWWAELPGKTHDPLMIIFRHTLPLAWYIKCFTSFSCQGIGNNLSFWFFTASIYTHAL